MPSGTATNQRTTELFCRVCECICLHTIISKLRGRLNHKVRCTGCNKESERQFMSYDQ